MRSDFTRWFVFFDVFLYSWLGPYILFVFFDYMCAAAASQMRQRHHETHCVTYAMNIIQQKIHIDGKNAMLFGHKALQRVGMLSFDHGARRQEAS